MKRSSKTWLAAALGLFVLALLYAAIVRVGRRLVSTGTGAVELMAPETPSARRSIKLQIDIIPHQSQRFDTPGDWYYDSAGVLHIVSSYLGDSPEDLRKECLIIAHECMDLMRYKKAGGGAGADGSERVLKQPTHSYWDQTGFSRTVERLLAAYLGVSWASYENTVNSLRWYGKKPAS